MLALASWPGAARPSAQAKPRADIARVNTVVVLLDDMRADELQFLPRTRRWLAQDGVRFKAAYAPTPLCCPARATLLTGQYAHNTRVFDNLPGGIRPGGLEAFDDDRTLATELESNGVTTGYVGKYLHGYHHVWVPPGWTDWRAATGGKYSYRDGDNGRSTVYDNPAKYGGATTYNINGKRRTIRGYETTVQTRLGTSFLRRRADTPFYLQLNYLAPHGSLGGPGGAGPPVPHESHEHDFDGLQAPRSDAFNEEDMTDKPRSLRRPLMGPRKKRRVNITAEARAETLQSVDDGMMAIRRALKREGFLRRTNVILTSDNGFTLGEHRLLLKKTWGYEPSATVPLLMAGPSVRRAGAVKSTPVGLHDLAPTITKWHGLGRMPGADGVPLVAGRIPRRDLVLQGTFEDRPKLSYTGLRTVQGYKYLEYRTGAVELYDLDRDPEELDNLAEDRAHRKLRARLAKRLSNLRGCEKAGCLARR